MFESFTRLCLQEFLSVDEAFLLTLIYKKDNNSLQILYNKDSSGYKYNLAILQSYGLIKVHGSNWVVDISMRKPGEELLSKYFKGLDDKDVENWIDDWRNLFPAGVNTSGYRYRGNRLECLKKMIKFASVYDYTKEEIFTATKEYINRFSMKGYAYIQQAHFFIEKQGVGSTLAEECNELRNKPMERASTKDDYGKRVI